MPVDNDNSYLATKNPFQGCVNGNKDHAIDEYVFPYRIRSDDWYEKQQHSKIKCMHKEITLEIWSNFGHCAHFCFFLLLIMERWKGWEILEKYQPYLEYFLHAQQQHYWPS